MNKQELIDRLRSLIDKEVFITANVNDSACAMWYVAGNAGNAIRGYSLDLPEGHRNMSNDLPQKYINAALSNLADEILDMQARLNWLFKL